MNFPEPLHYRGSRCRLGLSLSFHRRPGGFVKALKYFLFSVVCVGTAVVFVIFSWQNDRQVQLCFYKYCTREGLLSGFILVSFFLGMLFAGFFCAFPLLKNKATTMALKKQMKKYENEIQNPSPYRGVLNRSFSTHKILISRGKSEII